MMPIQMEMPAAARASDEGSSSIKKAVRVLRSLALAGDDADGVTHIAELANLPKSTAHRILAALISEGLVCRSEQRYRLGPGWFELQTALSSSEWHRIVRLAKRPLATLFESTEATIHFAVLSGDDVLYLEKLTGRLGTRVPTRVGERQPALCTALGKALIAHADPQQVHSLLAKPLPMVSRRSITSPRIMLSQLAEVRRTGVAYDIEEVHPGVSCVAAPVFRSGKAIAAVSVTRVGSGATQPTDAVAVRHAAAEITRWIEDDS